LDGTDFRIQEPSPFDRKWFSHKFHGPGLRYEVALSIKTGNIVWVNGGVPCGEYRNPLHFIYPNGNQIPYALHKRILARHETVNRRLKSWGVLGQIYRHDIDSHWLCFTAVANLVQVTIDLGDVLFSI
jgi:hypothetical protein